MTAYDIVILVVVGGSALSGLWRGLMYEAFEAVGFILGLVGVWQLSPSLAAHFPHSLPLSLKLIVASLIIFVGVFIAVMLVGTLIRKMLDHGAITVFDRVLGFIAGALKGAAFIIALAIVFSLFHWGQRLIEHGRSSKSVQLTMKVADPMKERYLKCVESVLKAKLAQMLPQIAQAIVAAPPTPTEPDTTADSSATPSPTPPQTLILDLNRIPPETMQQVQQLLNDPALAGLGLGRGLEDLKASGLTYIEISLDDLPPDARTKALNYLSGTSSTPDSGDAFTESDLKNLIPKGVDLEQVKKLAAGLR